MLRFVEINVYIKTSNFERANLLLQSKIDTVFQNIRKTKDDTIYICTTKKLHLNTSPCSCTSYEQLTRSIDSYIDSFDEIKVLKNVIEDWSCLMFIFDQIVIFRIRIVLNAIRWDFKAFDKVGTLAAQTEFIPLLHNNFN